MRTIDKLTATEMQKLQAGVDLLVETSHGHALAAGFATEGVRRNPAELIALLHSEASEMLEGFRSGITPSDKIPSFSSVEEEAADILIRVFDLAGEFQLRLADALVAKMWYNRSRPPKHGKAF